jgi:hypothetical protein
MLNLEIKKLLEAKIISQSRSPYASLVILVPKKDDSVRMCVENRRSNFLAIRGRGHESPIYKTICKARFGFQHLIRNRDIIKSCFD